MSKTDEVQKADQIRQADEARDALVSDIQELKKVPREVANKVEKKLPLIVGGVVTLAVVGVTLAVVMKPKRRWFEPKPASLFSKAVRAAAVSAAGMVARRLLSRNLSTVLPESKGEARDELASA